ncbi:hypothetical protein MMC34_003367 [Xylographa carneopallida]|nr:hypothetical protein [Xylographa carneopallida]
MGRHHAAPHQHHHRSSSFTPSSTTTSAPSTTTARRIRVLSNDADAERPPTLESKSKSWEWERWDLADAQTVVLGTVGAGLELGLGWELELELRLERIGGWIPGWKGTTAFLSTLRQNLALTTSLLPPDSPATTASSMSPPPSLHSSATLPPASPLTPSSSSSSSSSSSTTTSSASSTPLPPSTTPLPLDLPPLRTIPATSSSHKHAALHLLASALAQRRQAASSQLIRSRLFLGLVALALAVLLQTSYTGRASLPLIGTTLAGVVMALLVSVRWLAGGYLDLAERVDWAWLGDDEVWVALWGTEEVVVGAVVVRTERERVGKRRRRGVVRGWTVRLRERGRGVGRGLLEVVARVGRERGWEGVGMEEGGLCEFSFFFLFCFSVDRWCVCLVPGLGMEG